MRGFPADHQVHVPKNISEALELLRHPGHQWTPFAGGTDLMVQIEAGVMKPSKFIGLWNLRELAGITISAKELKIGAGTTYTELRENPHINSLFPMIVEAASVTGAVAIQNRGTLGGNIANASPAADTPPALLAYDAEVELTSHVGNRRVSYSEFHTGYKKTAMAESELITAIFLPIPAQGTFSLYKKVGTRSAQAISKVVFAGSITKGADLVVERIRIAYGSVGPTVLRARSVETLLTGKKLTKEGTAAAIAALRNDIKPIDDIRSTGNYREKVSENILKFFLDAAIAN